MRCIEPPKFTGFGGLLAVFQNRVCLVGPRMMKNLVNLSALRPLMFATLSFDSSSASLNRSCGTGYGACGDKL